MAMTYATIMCCAGGVQADGCLLAATKKVTAKGGNQGMGVNVKRARAQEAEANKHEKSKSRSHE